MNKLKVFQKNSYDLVLLDVMLPDIDGYSICKIMRGQSDVPIIMLTGLHNEESEIKVTLNNANYLGFCKGNESLDSFHENISCLIFKNKFTY